MSLQQDILEWVRDFEPWKQDLFLRASLAPELTDDDIRDAVGLLLGEHDERSSPREVALADMPGGAESERPLTLEAISDVENVNALVADLYSRFVQARQAAMIEEIRRACGITAVPAGAVEEEEPDEAAADVQAGTGPAEETLDELELETV